MSEHPRPWATTDGYLVDANGDRVYFSGHLGLTIAGRPPSNPADLFLMRAVNNHDALVEALKSCVDILLDQPGGSHGHDRALEARAVLDALTNSEGGGE